VTDETETILKIIETVDPADTAKLDEIDVRVWCWLNEYEYVPHDKIDKKNFCYRKYEGRDDLFFGSVGIEAGKYTRSRDTLTAIRPEGWTVANIVQHAGNLWFGAVLEKKIDIPPYPETKPLLLPTEELAELYVIIQAIEQERDGEYLASSLDER